MRKSSALSGRPSWIDTLRYSSIRDLFMIIIPWSSCASIEWNHQLKEAIKSSMRMEMVEASWDSEPEYSTQWWLTGKT
jgi:hypothetical protein